MATYEFRYFDKAGSSNIVRHKIETEAQAVALATMLFDSVRVELWKGDIRVAEFPQPSTAGISDPAPLSKPDRLTGCRDD